MKSLISLKLRKKVWAFFPEIFYSIFFIVIIIDSFYSLFNQGYETTTFLFLQIILPFLLLICMIGQLYWKNKALSVFFAIIFSLVSCYMYLALISEVYEFPQDSPEALKMFLTGSFIIIPFGIIAIRMPYKYIREINP